MHECEKTKMNKPKLPQPIFVRHTTASSILHVVTSIISQHLIEVELHSQRLLSHLALTPPPQYGPSRLEWCLCRLSLPPPDWHHWFTNEFPFSLRVNDHVWRGQEQQSHSSFVLQRHIVITRSVTLHM